MVGCSYLGQPEQVSEVRNLLGSNMSVRREVFERVGMFSDSLGRLGKNPTGCEETELCIRAAHGVPGGKVLYDPR
ncbi:glycosyl transferase family 2, partial [mine drainage metagenome]